MLARRKSIDTSSRDLKKTFETGGWRGNAARAGVWFTANTRALQRVKKEQERERKCDLQPASDVVPFRLSPLILAPTGPALFKKKKKKHTHTHTRSWDKIIELATLRPKSYRLERTNEPPRYLSRPLKSHFFFVWRNTRTLMIGVGCLSSPNSSKRTHT